MSNDKYRELFFDESDEYLEKLNDCLLTLEKNPEDDSVLDEIFRAAHTLKGMAATMGYNTMAELTHWMESVFELFRNGEVSVTSDIVSLIFKCLDKLSEIVEDLRVENYKEYDISDLLQQLKQVANKGSKAPKDVVESSLGASQIEITDSDYVVIRNAQDQGYGSYKIGVRISKGSLLKGARAFLVVNKLEQEGEIIDSLPHSDQLEEGNFDNTFELIYVSKLAEDKIVQIVEGNAEIEEVTIEKIKLDDSIIKEEFDESSKEEIEEESNKESKSETKKTGNNINQTIRVDLDKLDVFMNLVSELVIHRTRLESLSAEVKNAEMHESLEQVARITSELQDVVLKIRMQPVNVVFNRFPRMIRDLSKEMGKEINLVVEGDDTELDRTVVSEIGEPLVHLMRNAADHGIETIEKRQALGKPKTGTIRLVAYQEGNRVVIMVTDDGKGLDPKIIAESAERKGINTEGLGDKEIIQLIFNQGFSTVENVTNISGRGVGMDVVKQKISSLGGDINVVSEVDKGTSFIIKLPLTLSIIQALLIEAGGQVFALPLSLIEKIESVEEGAILQSHNRELYMYREKAIPVIRVNEKLGMDSAGENQYIIVTMIGDKYYGLLVEDLIGQQEIVIKKLGNIINRMRQYLGATILGNGDITLILDIQALINEGDYNEQGQ